MQEKKELISVIVPVYNVKKYLRKCIVSILNQSYSDIEIILVDDGSTDDSGCVCDSFAKQDSRIEVIHKKNGGLSEARNVGIDVAKGKYITFIDSDDWVSPEYIKNLYHLIQLYNADISVTCAIKVFENKNVDIQELYNEENNLLFTSENALEDMLYRKNIPVYAVAKMYKRTLFQDIKFPVGELFEDLSTGYKLFHLAERIAFNNVRDYFYMQRANSIITSNYNSKKMIQVYTCEKIIEFIQKEYPNIINAAKSKCFITTVNHYRSIPRNDEYAFDRQYCKNVINKYSVSVLKDKDNKTMTKIIAAIAIVNIDVIRYLSYIYQFLVNKGIIKLKRPI